MGVNKAVFLDKDGTLIPDIPFNVNTDLIRLSDHCVEGLQLLQRLGYIFIVVTNQSGIAFKYFGHKEVMAVGSKLESLMIQAGVKLSGFYYCPHAPATVLRFLLGKTCSCRKPKPGLLYRAANELNIDLSSSWLIGDILHDMEAGNLAGCKTVLIDNGNETEWCITDERTPDGLAADINEAAAYILAMDFQKNSYGKNACAVYQQF